MGRGSSKLSESNNKPKGGTGGGNGKDPITVQPFRINPEDLKAAIGQKGRPIGIVNAMEGANPFYDGSTGAQGDFSENCQRAVVAYELRRRGYDVLALPTYENDTLPIGGKWKGAFRGAKDISVGASTSQKTQQNLEAQMKSFGNGSRGIVRIPGHVFNVENVNGKVRYIDAQTNTVYNSNNVFSRIDKAGLQTIKLVRTDNLRLSDRAKKSVTPTTKLVKDILKRKNK